ncbi:hypothetical protein ACKWMZ_03835 [Pseudomonas protegens]|uniref:hypothetical protein n=1 Tax=Pseudomonas protegens TaxID=380021 RepID=UPI00381261AC
MEQQASRKSPGHPGLFYACTQHQLPAGARLPVNRFLGRPRIQQHILRTFYCFKASGTRFALGIPGEYAYAAPHICASTLQAVRAPDEADDFLAQSHSQPQELGVRFEGWCGLPKMNQASPREAGHKPAF